MLVIASAVIALLARPQTGFSNRNVTTEGIDIVMALDISSSMYAIDFQPNRITAAKEAAKEFIDNRPNDRIGLSWCLPERPLHNVPSPWIICC